jgi:hypothetical protein
MSTDSSMNERKNYGISCQVLPVTEFDGSKGIPAEKLAEIPVGGLVRDEVLLEALEIDCSPMGNGPPREGEDSKPGQGNQEPFLDDSADKGS